MKDSAIIDWFLTNIGYPIAAGIGIIIQWIVNKRQNSANAESTELSNAAKVIEKWKEWSDHMQAQIDRLEASMDKQRQECAEETRELTSKIQGHEERIRELEQENLDLKKKIP